MSNQTKACNLTEDEIECLIGFHGRSLGNFSAVKTDNSGTIDRINYLSKRLKTFKEPETEVVKSDNSAAGWGTGNG